MNDGVEIAIATFFVAWTVAILGGLVWLERQFASIRTDLASCLTKEEYERKHEALETRIRAAELCLRALTVKTGEKQ